MLASLLYKPVRDHPFQIFNEPWIVQSHPHLQIRLLHPRTIMIQLVKKAGEDVQVGALQTQSQDL